MDPQRTPKKDHKDKGATVGTGPQELQAPDAWEFREPQDTD